MRDNERIRVLAFIEARVLTGPAKNLIAFASRARVSSTTPVDVTIATYERGDPNTNKFIEYSRTAGIPTEIISENSRFDTRVIPAIRRLIRDLQPDIIQTHAVKSHFLMLLSRAWRTTPWIAFHHGYTATNWRDEAYNRLDRISLRWPAGIVTVCRPFQEEIQRQGVTTDRISIIHNSISSFNAPSDELVQETRRKFQLPEGIPVILSVGRLSREKGFSNLVEAVALIRDNDPARPFRLVIVGEGPERKTIQQRSESLGLADAVVLCGHQADVRPFYAIASVAAIASHSEGSPNAMLEAQAAGLPVVATRVGGIPEIAIDNVTALLVAKADRSAMAQAIERLLDNHQLASQLGKAAREHVLRHFTPEIQLRSLVALYRKVLSTTENKVS